MKPHAGKYSLNNPSVAFDHELDLWTLRDDDGYVVEYYITKEGALQALQDVIS